MKHPIIQFNIKNFGIIEAELYPEYAPLTVQNFVSLCQEHFFDGLIFHRVIKGFMIQGGGMDETMKPKETKPIKGEFSANRYPQNTLKHSRGVLSMARTSNPNSASSQFFIMHQDAPHLDGQYAGFGKVTKGMDVVDAIAGVKTVCRGWYDDVPADAVVIDKVEVISE